MGICLGVQVEAINMYLINNYLLNVDYMLQALLKEIVKRNRTQILPAKRFHDSRCNKTQ